MIMGLRAWLIQFRRCSCLVSLVVTVAMFADREATYAQRIGVTYSAEAQTDAARKRLSPAAQAVMARLSRLVALPVNDGRHHAGRLPTAETIELGGSSVQTIQIPFT